MSEDRIEQISKKARAAEEELLSHGPPLAAMTPLYHYGLDVPWLLERISELETENQRLRKAVGKDEAKAKRTDHLEEENQRLFEETKRLRATLEKREEHLAEVRRGGFTD